MREKRLVLDRKFLLENNFLNIVNILNLFTSQKLALFVHSAEGRRTEQKNDGGLELQGTGQLVRTVQQEIEAVRP